MNGVLSIDGPVTSDSSERARRLWGRKIVQPGFHRGSRAFLYLWGSTVPKFIVKIRDRYCEWSTIVDAPVSALLPLPEFREYYQDQYGKQGMRDLVTRLQRVEEYGTSAGPSTTLDSLLSVNRAGDNEARLSEDEIYEEYKKS